MTMTPALTYWLAGRIALATTLLALAYLIGAGAPTFDATPLGSDAGSYHPSHVQHDGTFRLEIDYVP